MFTDINEALAWLYAQKKVKKREDLSRINYCIDQLGLRPNYKVIHIAGTNGKGSTASFITKMLLLKNLNVGLFVSPFVVSFNERIQINLEYITDSDILRYVNLLYTFSLNYQNEFLDTIPFFELTFLMALMQFKEKNIDFAVIECGLGGRLDPTNAIKDTLVQVITNIGFDHMQTLGNTLEEIAYHKLGITRENKKCFTCIDDKVYDYFKRYALENNIDIEYVFKEVSNIISSDKTRFCYKNETYETSMNAKYQAYNASLAISVIKYLYPDYSKELIDLALQKTFWPGRFEYITNNIILDGAHNIHGIEALKDSLENKYINKKIKIVFTALHDKEIKTMLAILDRVAYYYYFTTIIDKRAVELEYFKDITLRPYELIDDYKKAITKAKEELTDNEILVITGSLHFISEARKYLLGDNS